MSIKKRGSRNPVKATAPPKFLPFQSKKCPSQKTCSKNSLSSIKPRHHLRWHTTVEVDELQINCIEGFVHNALLNMSRCIILLVALLVCVASLAPKNVLIIQNKGGGHGEIGFSLAKTLLAGNHKVTILQDTCDKATQPFSSYDQLKGASIVDTKLKDLEQLKTFLGSGKYDAVVDNNSKSTEAATCIANAVKSYGADSQYVYISSGGMYKGKSAASGFKEADGETKDDNECRMLEAFLETQDIAWTSMRPQYIYGDHTNKRINVDWFVDRIVRDRTVPMPGK